MPKYVAFSIPIVLCKISITGDVQNVKTQRTLGFHKSKAKNKYRKAKSHESIKESPKLDSNMKEETPQCMPTVQNVCRLKWAIL